MSSSSSSLSIPPIDIKLLPTLHIGNKEFTFDNGEWDEGFCHDLFTFYTSHNLPICIGKGGESLKSLRKEVVTLKEQINFLKVKLDIAMDLVFFLFFFFL